MGVGIFQHKGNKLDSLAIGKKPWAYRISTPQGLFCFRSASGPYHTAELAKAKRLVEFFIKLVWAFININTIKQIAQPLESSLVLIESVHRKDALFLVSNDRGPYCGARHS
jgi:hypothetical protein